MTEQRVAPPWHRPVEPPADADSAAVAETSPTACGAGTVLAGRFRLLAEMGADAAIGAKFWRAQDVVLERDVAVTVLHGSADSAVADRADDLLTRARRSGHLEHPGAARLLDVVGRDAAELPPGVLGLAITEWVPGRSLAEVVADGAVRTSAAVAMVEPLAGAAQQAHRQGLVLGCGQPQRIRITPDGRAAVAFALPRPETTPADDVRGLGATLYALLTRRWPLSAADATRAGLDGMHRDAEGTVQGPGNARPGIPAPLGSLISGTLGGESGVPRIRTAAAVHQTLSELREAEQGSVLLPPIDDGPPDADELWREEPPPELPDEAKRRRRLRIGLLSLGAALLVVAVYIGLQIAVLFGNPDNPGTLVVGPIGGASAPGPSERVSVAGAQVFDNTGDRDNAGRVSAVVDGNPATAWRTFTYRQQFPALKPGVGVMVSFASPVQLSDLAIWSSSRGTELELRAAPSADAALAATVPITRVTLRPGTTEVALGDSQPVNHVLVWIVKLGGGGDQHASEISELVFRRATG